MGLYSVFESALKHPKPLNEVEQAVWNSLTTASVSSRHAWHRGVLNTVKVHNQSVACINSRTVILRSVGRSPRFLECHTDARSEKMADVATCEIASWTFYDPQSRIQLRTSGRAAVINDTRADEAWDRTPFRSRDSYLSVAPPGQAVSGSSAPSTKDRNVTPEESERGRHNFRVIRLFVHEIDWLYLRRDGHLRMRAKYDSNGKITLVTWLVP